MKIKITAFDLAERFVGLAEVPGKVANPAILTMLRIDQSWPENDEVPWCSSLLNYVCWLLRLPRSKSLRARSWLQIGHPVTANEARRGFDVVILSRGEGEQPGPGVIEAPGHVGFFASRSGDDIYLLGGNQGDRVSVAAYKTKRLLGVRRLYG